jgi:hypothetical protein
MSYAMRIFFIVALLFVAVLLFGFVFNILFKVGMLLLLSLGIVYLIKKIAE